MKRKVSKRLLKHQKSKVKKTMKEYEQGELHIGGKKGPVVKNRKQAIAIALNSTKKK